MTRAQFRYIRVQHIDKGSTQRQHETPTWRLITQNRDYETCVKHNSQYNSCKHEPQYNEFKHEYRSNYLKHEYDHNSLKHEYRYNYF